MKTLLTIILATLMSSTYAQTYYSKEIITKYPSAKRLTYEVGTVRVDTSKNCFMLNPSKGRLKILIVPEIKHSNGIYKAMAIDKTGEVFLTLTGAYFRIEDRKRIIIYHFEMLQ